MVGVTARKLDRIYETIVFRHWSTAAQGFIPEKSETKVASPIFA